MLILFALTGLLDISEAAAPLSGPEKTHPPIDITTPPSQQHYRQKADMPICSGRLLGSYAVTINDQSLPKLLEALFGGSNYSYAIGSIYKMAGSNEQSNSADPPSHMASETSSCFRYCQSLYLSRETNYSTGKRINRPNIYFLIP